VSSALLNHKASPEDKYPGKSQEVMKMMSAKVFPHVQIPKAKAVIVAVGLSVRN
jgi:hypothetical protein